ncbi:MAG: ATP-binding protein [Gammaproteobacteria bacterium]|nr:ATP-binding protein [Gammaproteobacteria bacterium]
MFDSIFSNNSILLNAISTGLVVLDKELKIVHWNRWVANASGISPEEAYQKNLLEIFPTLESSRIYHAIQANFELGLPAVISNIFNQSPLPLFSNVKDTSDEKIPLLQHIQITQIRAENHNGKKQDEAYCLIHITDVTAGVKREKELEKHINERKLAEEAMSEARRIAEMANYAKSQFLANISHELRTPLNGIMGIVELLKECQMDEEASSYIEPLSDSSQSLFRIINDVLDYSQIDSESIILKPVSFNLKKFIENIESLTRQKASEKNLSFKLILSDIMPNKVIADQERLNQILNNLLDNAIKFTEVGTVSLCIEVLDKDSSHIIFKMSVKDTGIGIVEKKQMSIFDSFSQADGSSTRKYNGAGLGLAISKQLVDLMGGNLVVESKLGEGSIFSFKTEGSPQI